MPKMPRRKSPDLPPEILAFPTRLRYARERAGLTQTALAERSGIDKSQLTRWETGARGVGITVENLLKLARALGQPVGWLAADEGQPAIPVIREVTDRRRRPKPPALTVVPPPQPKGRREPEE